MAVILNASTSSGLVQTADTSGVIQIQNNGTTRLEANGTGVVVTGTGSVSGNLSFNSGYGSSAVAYGCRAWVNFNGTGTVAIRASGNVSSITDNGTGSFTVNFTTALPNANYAAVISGGKLANGDIMSYALDDDTYSTTQLQITGAKQVGQTEQDTTIYTCVVFR